MAVLYMTMSPLLEYKLVMNNYWKDTVFSDSLRVFMKENIFIYWGLDTADSKLCNKLYLGIKTVVKWVQLLS